MKTLRRSVLVTMLLASAVWTDTASAAPLGVAAKSLSGTARGIDNSQIIEVRSRRNRAGAAIAAGVAGAVIGGIIASQQRPYYGPYYGPVYGPSPVYRRYQAYDPAIEYCMRRYRSYDPYSMTYLGYDGYRHSCP